MFKKLWQWITGKVDTAKALIEAGWEFLKASISDEFKQFSGEWKDVAMRIVAEVGASGETEWRKKRDMAFDKLQAELIKRGASVKTRFVNKLIEAALDTVEPQ